MNSDALLPYSSALEAVLYFYAAGALIAYMLADHEITRDELFAVGATFTLVAWGFAYVYVVCQAIEPGSFIAAIEPEADRTWMELLFLSFTTLSSTGLSDVVPVQAFARGAGDDRAARGRGVHCRCGLPARGPDDPAARLMDGFGPKVFAWFKGLERDNTREYFTSTRDFYEDKVRGALEDLLHEIGGDDVKVFRQHRDLRFSAGQVAVQDAHVRDRRAALRARCRPRACTPGPATTGWSVISSSATASAVDEEPGRRRGGAERAGAGDPRRAAQDRAARLPARPSADRPAAPQAADRRRGAAGRRGISGERALAHARAVWEAAEPIIAWLDARVGRARCARAAPLTQASSSR